MSAAKQHIMAEIRRLARDNGGRPPGTRAFERETGIKDSDWYPRLWLRWGDALQDAGFTRNMFQKALSNETLLGNYARLAQRLGRLPLQDELILESMEGIDFPSEKTFAVLEVGASC